MKISPSFTKKVFPNEVSIPEFSVTYCIFCLIIYTAFRPKNIFKYSYIFKSKYIYISVSILKSFSVTYLNIHLYHNLIYFLLNKNLSYIVFIAYTFLLVRHDAKKRKKENSPLYSTLSRISSQYLY